MKTKLALLLGVFVIILVASGVILYPHSIACGIGVYSTCEVYLSAQEISGKKLSHETNSFTIEVGADSLIDLYSESPQCHMYTAELKEAIQLHSELLPILQTAPCSSIGPFEVATAAIRDNSFVISSGGEPPSSPNIVYLFDGLAGYKLAVLNGETILETSKLR